MLSALTPHRVVAIVALGVVALAAGFVAGLGLISVVNWIVPFNYPNDDDTLREFVPVAAAYLTWAITSATIFILGLRAVLRPR
jgi:hypothetical protein